MRAFDITVGQGTVVVKQAEMGRFTLTMTNLSGPARRALVKPVPSRKAVLRSSW